MGAAAMTYLMLQWPPLGLCHHDAMVLASTPSSCEFI